MFAERSVYLVRVRVRVRGRVRGRGRGRGRVRGRSAQRAPIAEEGDGHEVQHRKAEDERVEEGRLAINEPG